MKTSHKLLLGGGILALFAIIGYNQGWFNSGTNGSSGENKSNLETGGTCTINCKDANGMSQTCTGTMQKDGSCKPNDAKRCCGTGTIKTKSSGTL